ncbi:MAG: glycosyltransferase [Prevotella sp.]|nr:glycosyltransferase [Prevotella sp.]
MITISVITVTWQAADVLQPTLDSVSGQTWEQVEHLIIDGASTDATLQMAEDYQRDAQNNGCGHRVVISSEPDKGLYDAMNKGLSRATGDYVIFLNAGDRLAETTTLEKVAHAAMTAGDGMMPAVIYGYTDLIDSEGRRIGPRHLQPPAKLTWRSFRKGMLVCHQAFYARTDIARDIAYDTRYRYSADVDWCIRVMKEAERRSLPLTRIDSVVALFMEGGQTTEHHRDSLKERFRVMRSHYGLVTTSAMHVWFVFRSLSTKIKRK